jgi:hypothetical protein
VVTVLWHNNTLVGEENLKHYEKFLKYVSSKKAWIASGEEICNWWSTNVEKK